jgi:hypothetical protein
MGASLTEHRFVAMGCGSTHCGSTHYREHMGHEQKLKTIGRLDGMRGKITPACFSVGASTLISLPEPLRCSCFFFWSV